MDSCQPFPLAIHFVSDMILEDVTLYMYVYIRYIYTSIYDIHQYIYIHICIYLVTICESSWPWLFLHLSISILLHLCVCRVTFRQALHDQSPSWSHSDLPSGWLVQMFCWLYQVESKRCTYGQEYIDTMISISDFLVAFLRKGYIRIDRAISLYDYINTIFL